MPLDSTLDKIQIRDRGAMLRAPLLESSLIVETRFAKTVQLTRRALELPVNEATG